MIVIRLIGGLGNQMFEYAMAKSLADRNKSKLYIDLSWIRNFEKKNVKLFGLDNFNITSKSTRLNFIFIFCLKLISFFVKRSKYTQNLFQKVLIIEKSFSYDNRISNLKTNNSIVFEGYWQSYKYFIGIEDVIRREFEFRKTVPDKYNPYLNRIISENSISIHVRRGDYVLNSELKKIYNNFGLEYYIDAMEFMENRISSILYFVFSDDISWAKSSFSKLGRNLVFIDIDSEGNANPIGHKDNGYIDMYLMSQCKHNIIANSSFSWWAAWLNGNAQKIVIAPEKWFSHETDLSDLIPADWVIL